MAEQREKRLYFTGKKGKDGRPLENLESIPARDLSERDIRRLTDEQYEMVMESKLYQKTEPASRKQERQSEPEVQETAVPEQEPDIGWDMDTGDE